MGLEYFPCYHSYAKKCEKLTDQELGRLFRALMLFSETGERQELAGRESIAFDFIADDIARAKDAYDDKCRKNAENASKRYAANEYDRIRPHTNGYETCQNKDKDKSKNKDNALKSAENKRAREARFTPPTVEEVAAYCRERGNSVDAQRFVDFYASKGWKVGSQHMVDFKAAVRTWERREDVKQRSEKPAAESERPKPTAQDLERTKRALEAIRGE